MSQSYFFETVRLFTEQSSIQSSTLSNGVSYIAAIQLRKQLSNDEK